MLIPDLSGRVAGLESSETFADVNGSPQLAIHALDSGVHAPDLGDPLVPEGVDLDREASVHRVDLLIQEPDVAAERMQLGGDDVLERLLDLIVHAHGRHSIRSHRARQCPDRDTGRTQTCSVALPECPPPHLAQELPSRERAIVAAFLNFQPPASRVHSSGLPPTSPTRPTHHTPHTCTSPPGWGSCKRRK